MATTISVTKSSETGVRISCQAMDSARCLLMLHAYACFGRHDRPGEFFSRTSWGYVRAQVREYLNTLTERLEL